VQQCHFTVGSFRAASFTSLLNHWRP
jgi:hypothetical protein